MSRLDELFILSLADRFEGNTGTLIKITNPTMVICRCKNYNQIQPKLQKKLKLTNLKIPSGNSSIPPVARNPSNISSQFKSKVGGRAVGFSNTCFE